jgi:SulP family sulfate permease
VLAVNAVLAVAVGCSLYVLRALWVRLVRPEGVPDLQVL